MRSDANGHWHQATCEHADLKEDLSNHVYEGDSLVCTVCGYEKPHTCVAKEQWVQGKTEHWKICKFCGKVIESTRQAHDGMPCSVCGYELGVAMGLTYIPDETQTGYLVSGYEEIESDLRIPATYNSKPVVGIAEQAFMNCKTIKTVLLPNSIKSVANYSFAYCSKLKSVNLGNGLETIGESAFAYTAIESITLPPTLRTIGNGAFEYADLTSVTIPANVTRIGSFAFRNYHGNSEGKELAEVHFENTVGWKVYPLSYDFDPTVEGEVINVTDAAQNARNMIIPNNPYNNQYGYAQYIWVRG